MPSYRIFLLLSVLSTLGGPALAQGEFGNRFIADKRLPIVLDRTDKKLSFRFTCQEDMDLTAASVYCVDALSPPAFKISLQEDEGGRPSGKVLSASSFVPLPRSWSTVPLDHNPLFQGKVYHLVLEQDTLRGGEHPVGLIGPDHQASFLTTDVLNHLHPNDGSPDPNCDTLTSEKGRWKRKGQEPVYALFGSGSHSQGNPYDDPGSAPICGAQDPKDKAHQVLQGQSLHFHCGFAATDLVIRVRKEGNPKSPLNYRILKHNFHIHQTIPIYEAQALAPSQAASSFQWVTIGFKDKGKTNFSAECWFLVLQTDSGSPSDQAPGCRDCYLLSAPGNSGGLAQASDLTFDGGAHLSRAVHSVTGGEAYSWIDDFERDANLCALGPLCPPGPVMEFEPAPTPFPLLRGFPWGLK